MKLSEEYVRIDFDFLFKILSIEHYLYVDETNQK